MNLELLRKELERYEGVKNTVYLDSLGLKTAGIGHLLVGNETSMHVGTTVSDSQIETWFENDIKIATDRARKIIGPSFDQFNDFYQRIFVNLCFNMGDKFAQFTNTLKFVRNQDWENAANNLSQSLWYKQVGNRGKEMVDAIKHGKYSWET